MELWLIAHFVKLERLSRTENDCLLREIAVIGIIQRVYGSQPTASKEDIQFVFRPSTKSLMSILTLRGLSRLLLNMSDVTVG